MAFSTTSISGRYDLSCDGSMKIGGVELEGFKSGSISFSADSVDNSTRDGSGWMAETPGKRSCTLEVTCNKIAAGSTASTGCQAGLRGLMLDNDFMTKAVQVVYTSKKWNTPVTAGEVATGFSGTFVLTGMSEKQEAGGEAVELTFSFKNYGALSSDPTPNV